MLVVIMQCTNGVGSNHVEGRGVRISVMVFNATFNNISVISWRSVVMAENTEVPEENHCTGACH